MSYAICFDAPGGPEVFTWRELPVPMPGSGEVLIRQSAVGVNFIDTYHRTGLYPLPSYPAVPGLEGCGVVEACGAGVSEFRPGDRVAYAGGPVGAYAERRVMPAEWLVRVPDALDDVQAAAILVKGLTAHFLAHRTFPIQPGHRVLIHAAAGGVGLLLTQWAKRLGAEVFGTVSTAEKAQAAHAAGCDQVIFYTSENVTERVGELTNGEGVHAVYDSVGKDTFLASLDCLARFGMLVSFGQSSGPVPEFSPLLLQQKGSLYLTRPTLLHHLLDRAYYTIAADELFTLTAQGKLHVAVDRTLPLKDAAEAHRLLEARKTSGSVVLLP